MNQQSFRATAYLKIGCPYSFKFLLFMSEAGLLDQIDVVRCDPDDVNFPSIKEKLAKGLGAAATFPAVEVASGRYQADSDRLIERFAKQHGVLVDRLPAFSFYKASIYPQLVNLHK